MEASVGDGAEGEAEPVDLGLDGSLDRALVDASEPLTEEVQPANAMRDVTSTVTRSVPRLFTRG